MMLCRRQQVADKTLLFGGMVLGERNGALAVTGGADKFCFCLASSASDRVVEGTVPIIDGNVLTFSFACSKR